MIRFVGLVRCGDERLSCASGCMLSWLHAVMAACLLYHSLSTSEPVLMRSWEHAACPLAHAPLYVLVLLGHAGDVLVVGPE